MKRKIFTFFQKKHTSKIEFSSSCYYIIYVIQKQKYDRERKTVCRYDCEP